MSLFVLSLRLTGDLFVPVDFDRRIKRRAAVGGCWREGEPSRVSGRVVCRPLRAHERRGYSLIFLASFSCVR